MAYIEERKLKKGKSYAIRFELGGKERRVSLDSSYSRSDAKAAKEAIDGYFRAKKLGEPLDRKTRAFFDDAPKDLIKRFSVLGFDSVKKTLPICDVWEAYSRDQEGIVKGSSLIHRETVWKRFTAYFPKDVRFPDLTQAKVQAFRDEMTRQYASTTVSKTVADLRAFGNWAVKREYAEENPFMMIERGATSNRSRDCQIPAEWTERILDACPTQEWRTLYCLWRHAGLRQQEPFGLKPSDVDLKRLRLTVHATKTERYADGGRRDAPICPILATELEAQLKTVSGDDRYLIWKNRNVAIHSGFSAILRRAGLEPYPKLIQNLRSSCENDWVASGIPAHVVASWIGHSVKVQEAHYLRVLPEYFQRVTGETATKPLQI